MRMADLNLVIAVGGGFLSFISPCCLPLYPAFLSYITGMSVNDLKEENGMLKRKSMLHTLFFLIGFSIIFVALGFGSSFVGKIFQNYDGLIRQLGAILIIFFGLVVVGIFKPSFLMKDRRLSFTQRPSGFLGSIVIGMAFAAGWMPCTGPILASVIALSAIHPGSGMAYMVAYALGFAIPFFILSFFIGHLKWIKRNSALFVKGGGYLMVAMGIVLYFDWMTKIIAYSSSLLGGFRGF